MLERFYQLNSLLIDAFNSKNKSEVKVLANEYLNLAAQNKNNWNYGNAIHQAYTFLGLVAMESEEIEKAKEFLILSGQTPGSPQLNTFGPNMVLAKALLEKGEYQVVFTYLEMCKSFWGWFFRFNKISNWKKAIKKKKIPNFGGNLLYHVRKAK